MERQIATTAEQSARLLKCGVSAYVADMTLSYCKGGFYELMATPFHYGCFNEEDAPAWSLSTLLGLLPKEIKVDESPYDEIQKYGLLIYPYMGGWQVDYQYCEDDECHCLKCVYGADLIEACVKAIEWLSANGYALELIKKGE